MKPIQIEVKGTARRGGKPGARGGIHRADEELAVLAKALAHPARVAILRLLLRDGSCICGALVDRMPLAQATVSQHLKVLKSAGLLKGEIDGPRVCYCAEPAKLEQLKTLLLELGTTHKGESS